MPFERVYTHAAPGPAPSPNPPTMAVLPSPDSETAEPWYARPTAPVPTSFAPCWLQTPPERVNTQAAPASALSKGPPRMAVFPSRESETEKPCPAPKGPTAPIPINFACWLHTLAERVYTHAAPARLL